ncbi:MAG TPA: phospholipase D family protein [Ktedonobacteraceae bacterium]|nr:phospholipase D family protein [Ktedonobacteraceae bacterium]
MTNDEYHASVVPVPSPWLDILLDALRRIQHTLLIVSPYIKQEAVTVMEQALLAGMSGRNRNIEIRVITRVNPEDFLSGACDISALQQLLNWSITIPGSTIEMRAIPNLHAKVWICDRQLAIIGSGNATLPGLSRNLEYGLAVADPQLVERILNDWQQWWDPAHHVEAPVVDDLSQKLQAIKKSDDMRQIQAQNERLTQQVRRLPRVGKAVTFSRKEKRLASPIIKEPSFPISLTDPNLNVIDKTAYITLPAPNGLTEPDISQETIDVSVIAFWQALNWVLPFDETAPGMISDSIAPDAYLKLSWKSTPIEHQMLQLIWADGRRYSQASLPTHNETVKQSWAITLNRKQIRALGDVLRILKEEDFFVKRAQQQFHVRLNTSPYTLSIAYLRNPMDRFSSVAMITPCTAASIPGNFQILHPPLSCITIAHEHLQNALITLKQEWESMHTTGYPLTIVELSFATPGATSSLTLSTGQIEASITRSIPGTDCTFAGSEARLRIDIDALQQVIASRSENVHSWRLCVDRYADAVQFVPELAVFADTTLVWRHEMRNL